MLVDVMEYKGLKITVSTDSGKFRVNGEGIYDTLIAAKSAADRRVSNEKKVSTKFAPIPVVGALNDKVTKSKIKGFHGKTALPLFDGPALDKRDTMLPDITGAMLPDITGADTLVKLSLAADALYDQNHRVMRLCRLDWEQVYSDLNYDKVVANNIRKFAASKKAIERIKHKALLALEALEAALELMQKVK